MAFCLDEGRGFGPVVVGAIGQRQEKGITVTRSPRRDLPLASLQPQNPTVGPCHDSRPRAPVQHHPMGAHPCPHAQPCGCHPEVEQQAGRAASTRLPFPHGKQPGRWPLREEKPLIHSHLIGGMAIQKIIEI